MTYLEAKAQAQSLINDATNTAITDGDWLKFANETQSEIAFLTRCLYGSVNDPPIEGALGEPIFPRPEPLIAIYGAYFNGFTGSPYTAELAVTDERFMNRFHFGWRRETGDPTHLVICGDHYALYPTPLNGQTTLWGAIMPEPLSGADPQIALPAFLAQWMPYGMAIRACVRLPDSDKTQARLGYLQSRYDQGLAHGRLETLNEGGKTGNG